MIVYEDDSLVVVHKPPGMLSQPDQKGGVNVYDEVCRLTGLPSLGLIQRLDRPVGGLMVLTKTDQANRALTQAVTERKIQKKYLAVVNGQPKEAETLSHYIQKARGNKAIVSNKKTALSKKAVLSYRLIEKTIDSITKEEKSLLEVSLETGRFHQIRAQLAHNKLAIIGDTKYNESYTKRNEWSEIGLFAYYLSFVHPKTNQRMVFKLRPISDPFILFSDTIQLMVERNDNER